MSRDVPESEFHEERVARFIDLAQAAQEASSLAADPVLQVTYAKLASQWVELALMARRMAAASRPQSVPETDPQTRVN